MKKARFSEIQIVGILKETEAGLKVEDVCCKHGIAASTYYKWKSPYSGMEISKLKRMKTLESEKETLKQLFAELRKLCA